MAKASAIFTLLCAARSLMSRSENLNRISCCDRERLLVVKGDTKDAERGCGCGE
jgi:hypothetical protein